MRAGETTRAELVEKGWALPETVPPMPRRVEQEAVQAAVEEHRATPPAVRGVAPILNPARLRPPGVERSRPRRESVPRFLCMWCQCPETMIDPDTKEVMRLTKFVYRESHKVYATFRICQTCEEGVRKFRGSITTMLRVVLGLMQARQAREPLPTLETATFEPSQLTGDVEDGEIVEDGE